MPGGVDMSADQDVRPTAKERPRAFEQRLIAPPNRGGRPHGDSSEAANDSTTHYPRQGEVEGPHQTESHEPAIRRILRISVEDEIAMRAEQSPPRDLDGDGLPRHSHSRELFEATLDKVVPISGNKEHADARAHARSNLLQDIPIVLRGQVSRTQPIVEDISQEIQRLEAARLRIQEFDEGTPLLGGFRLEMDVGDESDPAQGSYPIGIHMDFWITRS